MQFLLWLADLADSIVLFASVAGWLRRRGRSDATNDVTDQPGVATGPPPPAPYAPAPQDGGTVGWVAPTRVEGAPVEATRGCLVPLGFVIGLLGPAFAVFTMMGGDVAVVVAVLVGSGGVAGLLCAAGLRGVRGGIAVLLIPLVWSVLALYMLISMWSGGDFEPGEGIEAAAPIALFILVVAASTEGGYLAGRLLARLVVVTNDVVDNGRG